MMNIPTAPLLLSLLLHDDLSHAELTQLCGADPTLMLEHLHEEGLVLHDERGARLYALSDLGVARALRARAWN